MGPRIGRFDKDGRAVKMPGHSVPLSALGGLILVFGFFACNGTKQVRSASQDPPRGPHFYYVRWVFHPLSWLHTILTLPLSPRRGHNLWVVSSSIFNLYSSAVRGNAKH